MLAVDLCGKPVLTETIILVKVTSLNLKPPLNQQRLISLFTSPMSDFPTVLRFFYIEYHAVFKIFVCVFLQFLVEV